MGSLYGCWIFDDKVGISARAKLPVVPSASQDSRHALINYDGPVVLACDSENTVLPDMRRDSEGICGVWDGRLDNRDAITREIGISSNCDQSDIECVLTAFSKWETRAFPRFRGDWTATLWNARTRTLTLAKDPMGTRPLYYSRTPAGILWSNSLEWLVRQRDKFLDLNLEYLAGWLSFFAAADLTPFSSIHSVPPSSFVQLQSNAVIVRKYWEFQPSETICYLDQAQYDEHFLAVFTNSVRRRLRSEKSKPLLAELSGGMDSSSIVCVADALLAREPGLTPRLDTLSYYDDNEPNWDERPYFSTVESKRGRTGFHFPVDAAESLAPLFETATFAATPAELGRSSVGQARTASLQSQGYGAILSGIGGDEFTGGVPTAIPELAELLAAGKIRSLAGRLKDWSLSQRRPWIHVLFETLCAFLPAAYLSRSARRPPMWLDPRFRKQFRPVLSGYDTPLRFSGPRPSFQENLSTVDALRRQLAASNTNPEKNLEKRYPFLDVDFLQFVFALPRDQLLRPGRRRFLMRRALVGVVPEEILNRKRKAYVVRAPRIAIVSHWENLQSLTHNMLAESLGIVSSSLFRQALENIHDGKDLAIVPVQRMLQLESWLRRVSEHGICRSSQLPGSEFANHPPTYAVAKQISAS